MARDLGSQGPDPDEPDPDEQEPEDRDPGLRDAARSALARARAEARARGLRPGNKPLRRRARDLPDRGAGRIARGDTGRDPQLLGDEVSGLIAERGWQVDVSAGSVMGRWTQIVGADIAAHCSPVSFELGRLVVRAESTAWATQLRLLHSTLLARIEAEAGHGVVTDLHIVGPSAPSWSRGPRKVSDGRGQRDTYG